MKINKFPYWFINEIAEEDRSKAIIGSLRSSDVIRFICPIHGVYSQRVGDHIRISTMEKTSGCPRCARSKAGSMRYRRPKLPQWFVNDLYYDEDKKKAIDGTIDLTGKLTFNCAIHGPYEQYATTHIRVLTGERVSGCPKCVVGNYRSSFEEDVYSVLSTKNIRIERNVKGYLTNKQSELDIYLPDYSIGLS